MLYNYRKVQNVKYINQTNRGREILSCAKCAKIVEFAFFCTILKQLRIATTTNKCCFASC